MKVQAPNRLKRTKEKGPKVPARQVLERPPTREVRRGRASLGRKRQVARSNESRIGTSISEGARLSFRSIPA